MAKEDVGPLPEVVPKKRRLIEHIADLHLAMWLDSDILTPLERKKLTAEKERRKTLRPDVKLALLVPQEGMTPVQFKRYQDIIKTYGATEVNFPTLPSKVYYVLKQMENVEKHQFGTALGHDLACMNAIKESTTALAFPKTRVTWDVVKYAKHRSMPVRVVYPDGQEVTA